MNQNIQINERAQQLLKHLVACYIREGQPVGSKTLAQETELGISPATARNIMADLEIAGFLNSPHTSAGRIPTALGYRFFVDSLLNTKSFDGREADDAAQQLQDCVDAKELVSAASTMLSGMTKLASVVMLPRRGGAILKHVEFVSLSDNRVLVILVFNKHEVQNRIIYTERRYSSSELQQVGNYLTANFAGKDLTQIRSELVAAMRKDRNNIDLLTQAILDVSNSAGDYVTSGESNLFELADQTGVDKLRFLFEAFAQKRDILHLLDRCLHADGVKIYIGEESGYELLDECSVIAKPYYDNGKIVGVLGVIGPTRMPYERAIAAVDITAKLLSTAFEEME